MTKWDAVGFAGALLIVTGVTWIYEPAGFIVAGIMLLCAAILSGLKS